MSTRAGAAVMLACAAVVLACAGCVLGGAGQGSQGGQGRGGSGSVTVQVGGTQVYLQRPGREVTPCRRDLEQQGITWSGSEFLLRVEYGDAVVARRFLQCGILTGGDSLLGREAVLRAATAGRDEILGALLAAGAPDDAAVEDDDTPLAAATRAGHAGAALLLLAAGAPPRDRLQQRPGDKTRPLAPLLGTLLGASARVSPAACAALPTAAPATARPGDALAQTLGHRDLTSLAAALCRGVTPLPPTDPRRPR